MLYGVLIFCSLVRTVHYYQHLGERHVQQMRARRVIILPIAQSWLGVE
jgi:hypothetical protein